MAGHIHPAIRLKGKGKQSIQLPCFVFREHNAILPAFGSFTGTATIQAKPGDQVYAIADKQVIKVK